MNETLSHNKVPAASVAPAAQEGKNPHTADAAALPSERSSATKGWLITASYTLSLAIFAWSIALSMRSTAETPPPTSAAATQAAPPAVDRSRPAESRSGAAPRAEVEPSSEGDAYRAEALALDRQFMQRQKQRRRSLAPSPSHQDAVGRWHAQVDRLREQLRDHPNPKEGSVLWGQKRQLEALLADPPIPPSSAP